MKNKYNLTIPKIRKLKVADRSLIGSPLFWRNDVIHAWCISESVGTKEDRLYGTDNSFWIGIYDNDAPAYAGKFRFSLETYGGMCSYNFTKFFRSKDIQNENDRLVQERFLTQITELLDLGILTPIKRTNGSLNTCTTEILKHEISGRVKMSDKIKGYKVFWPDWTCRGFQYTCPGIFEEDVDPKICGRGFHFCLNLADCFGYYPFDPENKVAEVVCLGQIAGEDDKRCTNKIEIVRELTWEEVLKLVNTGKGCSGCCNSGDYNSGHHNSGNYNSGVGNSSYCNSGSCNSGHHNSGSYNSGHHNSGSWNSGDYNCGDHNCGDWNKADCSSGCFNTESQKIDMFNKPSDWTYRDWVESRAHCLLWEMPSDNVRFIQIDKMSDKEKKEHPEAMITGGYLKVTTVNHSCRQEWWDTLSAEEKDVIRAIPNFDAAIFREITGIDTEKRTE